MTFPFGALRSEQMAPARLTAQDFPGASHFKALGYRLFRLTSSDRFWHKEHVHYARSSDSQGQNPFVSTRATGRQTTPGSNEARPPSSAAAQGKSEVQLQKAGHATESDHDDRADYRKNQACRMKRRSIRGLGEQSRD
jgi:hypothetical protein